MFRTTRIALLVTALALGIGLAGPALAADNDTCPHSATAASLHECVSHAVAEGHITSAPLAARLHTALDQAQLALDRGSNRAAIIWLTRFQSLVTNAVGHGIDQVHADHLTHHAATVINALQRVGKVR